MPCFVESNGRCSPYVRPPIVIIVHPPLADTNDPQSFGLTEQSGVDKLALIRSSLSRIHTNPARGWRSGQGHGASKVSGQPISLGTAEYGIRLLTKSTRRHRVRQQTEIAWRTFKRFTYWATG